MKSPGEPGPDEDLRWASRHDAKDNIRGGGHGHLPVSQKCHVARPAHRVLSQEPVGSPKGEGKGQRCQTTQDKQIVQVVRTSGSTATPLQSRGSGRSQVINGKGQQKRCIVHMYWRDRPSSGGHDISCGRWKTTSRGAWAEASRTGGFGPRGPAASRRLTGGALAGDVYDAPEIVDKSTCSGRVVKRCLIWSSCRLSAWTRTDFYTRRRPCIDPKHQRVYIATTAMSRREGAHRSSRGGYQDRQDFGLRGRGGGPGSSPARSELWCRFQGR